MTLIWRWMNSAGLSPWLLDHTAILLLNSCNLITSVLLSVLLLYKKDQQKMVEAGDPC